MAILDTVLIGFVGEFTHGGLKQFGGLGDVAPGIFQRIDYHFFFQVGDRFFERHSSLACPALDPESGRCDLYSWRPVSCRTYGPPARFGGEQTPPCRLCFVGVPPEEVEACRMEPDREGLEESILAGMGVSGGDDWETLIAFPLLQA